MSNFHPGQHCMIVESEAGNIGRVVTLVGYIGYVKGFKYDGYWSIEETINSLLGYSINIAAEFQLMPLDGVPVSAARTRQGQADETKL